MKGERIFQALGDISDELIVRADQPVRRRTDWLRWGALAACCALVLGVAALVLPLPGFDAKSSETAANTAETPYMLEDKSEPEIETAQITTDEAAPEETEPEQLHLPATAAAQQNTTGGVPDERGTAQEDFVNVVRVEVNDNILKNCAEYAQALGYETGELEMAVLLGEDLLGDVYCEEDAKQALLDSGDIVVIFENIRCVVDAETEIVLGRIPLA